MFVEVVRLFIVLLGTAAGYWVARDIGPTTAVAPAGLGAIIGCLVGYSGGGVLGRTLEHAADIVERKTASAPPAAVLAGLGGAMAGAVGGVVVGVPLLVLVDPRIALPVVGLISWFGGYLGYRITVTKSVEMLGLLGLSTRPLVRATPYDHRDGMLVDTSAVMDGQLLTLARSGLVGGDLLVPRFVLEELQGLADAPDPTRSRRAQRGLETLELLRHEGSTRVYVLDDEVPEHAAVDTKLVALARRLQVRILTNDGNLARVADVQGVPTCNLRRLAVELGPTMMAGDVARVMVQRPGREDGQGVGYLDDGSMVVVNDGVQLVGHEVEVEVTAVVPTAMGRLLFARPLRTVDSEHA